VTGSARPPRSRRGDGGNTVVEAAILAPVFIMFIAGLLVADRIRHASDVVSQAAADAARHASIARNPIQARREATASALATLRQADLHRTAQVSLDLSGFTRPAGQPAMVAATVTCRVRLADVTAGAMPGSREIRATHRSPLDLYRAR
jgi:Flp pilus assembly protein TadG